MLPAKAPHPQAVYRVDMPAEHAAQMQRLYLAIEKINASKKYPVMRVTQVGSWPWRMYLKEYMKSKGMPISEALMAILDSGDWDLRIEPADDTITLSIPQLTTFVAELLEILDIKRTIPFQYYFNTKWELADISVQSTQIKPINCYDINLNVQGEILFDDSLNDTPGTHRNLFMRFIENKEIITPHIFGTLETFKKSIEQNRELSPIEASRLYFMMKSYIKPLKIPGVHFHLNTSQAWCHFMMMPGTRDYYKQLREKILSRYHYTESDYQLFEMASQKAYIQDTIPRLDDRYNQLLHDLGAYKKIQKEDFEGIEPDNIQAKLSSIKTSQDVYDLNIVLTTAIERISPALCALKQKSKEPIEQPKVSEVNQPKPEMKPTSRKVTPKIHPESLCELKHLDPDNMPAKALVDLCLAHIRNNFRIRKLANDVAHMYEYLWQEMFIIYGSAYRELSRKQRSLFLSGLIITVQKERFPLERSGDMRDSIISYFLNTFYNVPMSIIGDSEVRRNYVSGLYVWFELIKPFGVSDIEAFMSDFLADHQTLYDHLTKESLIKEFEAVKQRIAMLDRHPLVKPLVSGVNLPNDKGGGSSAGTRFMSYLYRDGRVVEKLLFPNAFYSCVRILIETEIMYHQATLKINATQDTAVIAGESFIRSILTQSRHVLTLPISHSDKEAFETFVAHFKFCVRIYRQLYNRRYQERLQVHDTLMPIILREALLGEKKPRTVEQLFLGALPTYKKTYPDHEPSMEDLNIHSLPAIQAAAELGNLLYCWDPRKPAGQKALYDAHIRGANSLTYLKDMQQLMIQFANIQSVEPMSNFDKVYARFNSFIEYHQKQKSSNSLILS